MTIPAPTGWLDETSNTVIPFSTGNWNNLSGTTWESWKEWVINPSLLRYNSGIISLPQEKTFNLIIKTEATGNVDYIIYTSSTGAFNGEEVATTISYNSSTAPTFTTQYFVIEIIVNRTSQLPTILDFEYTTNQTPLYLSFNNLDTSSLSGTVSNRQIPTTKFSGTAINIQITPKQVTDYVPDLYVSSTQLSNTVIPTIISRQPISFKLVGIDNQPRDAIVDVSIEYLATGYRSGNNLLVK